MKTFFMTSYLLVLALEMGLRCLDQRHRQRHRGEVPPGFEGAVSAETLERAGDYALARKRLEWVESVVAETLVLLFLFTPLFPAYDRLAAASSGSPLWGGVLFFLGLSGLRWLLDAPFSWYRTFRIEERFGFNRTTFRLWLSDQLKSLLLAAILIALLAAGSLWLVAATTHWWLWVWGLWMGISLFLMVLSPYLIEPLFFKFQPLADGELAERVRDLMARAGLRAGQVLQVDASRRSGHSNAYFTGIGKVKRIVLFDTLLAQMNPEEIEAVLAHEIGHWRLRHILQRLLFSALVSLAGFHLACGLMAWGGIPSWVGAPALSPAAQLLVLAVAGRLAGFFMTPLGAAWSRRHEAQADDFAVNLTAHPRALAAALVKLAGENLANLFPHPLYAWFYYSHPPVAERVTRLNALQPSPCGYGGGGGDNIDIPLM
ncbi:MAG: M48 family metallopeptidase [Deltaproteobacteria bacterium]|nr:M48 family metallopeptidase [Deltaproteobacteria bacterium]